MAGDAAVSRVFLPSVRGEVLKGRTCLFHDVPNPKAALGGPWLPLGWASDHHLASAVKESRACIGRRAPCTTAQSGCLGRCRPVSKLHLGYF